MHPPQAFSVDCQSEKSAFVLAVAEAMCVGPMAAFMIALSEIEYRTTQALA
jgi:hypothetical protein